MRRRVIASLVSFVVAIACLLSLSPSSASAHAILDSSTPSPSSVVAVSPSEIRLDFNEQVEASFGDIRLFDSKQREIDIDKTIRSDVDNSIVSAQLPALKDGVYVAVWRVVSADGHPANGAFPFEVGETSSGNSNDLLQKILLGLNKTSDLETPMALMRFVAFLSTMILIGSATLARQGQHFSVRGLVRLAQYATIGIAIGSVGVLLLQGPIATGRSWGSVFDGAVLSDVITTRLGVAVLLRLLLVVAWGGLLLFATSSSHRRWKLTAVITSVLLVATFSFSGHPSAAPNSLFFIPIDMAHFVSLSMWVGALFALVVVSRTEHAQEYVQRFSRIATFAMPVAVVTGVIQGLHLVGGISAMTKSDYGRLLIVKTILALIVIGLGTRARRRLHSVEPKSAGKTIRLEALIVILVVACTALLVGKSPVVADSFDDLTFSASLVQANVVGDFSVLPTKVGAAEVHAIMSPPGGAMSPVVNVVVTFALPSRDIPAIPVVMSSVGPNHWVGVVQFPYEGKWQMEIRVSPKKNETLLYKSEVDVVD
jgi:copper transport protein